MGENKKKRTLKMVMSNFTDDLWIEILLRLPFEALLRFKSVSKSWLSIISSHRFAKSHLAIAAKDDQNLIVHHESGEPEVGDDGHFSLFNLNSGRLSENLKFPFSQGEYPFEPGYTPLIGSDCGIVCVCVSVSNWRVAKNNFDLYLWNPATKHSKLLAPYTMPEDRTRSHGALGFGFDHMDLDFKVVRVVSSTLCAEVYSSNRNNWRKIKSKPLTMLYREEFHVCFHGFLFTIGHNGGMMAFNLNKEVFICDINLPVASFDDNESPIGTRIVDFRDTIAVIIPTDKGNMNLCTLDNEACLCGGGVKASWTKVLSIDVGMPLGFVEGLFNNVQFLLVDEDGERFLYNSSNKVTTYVPSPPSLEPFEFFKYTKSLFSLVGFRRIKWTQDLDESSGMLEGLF